MSILLEPNRQDVRSAYLRGLNEAFGSWGGDPEFDWYFERDVGEGAADLFTSGVDGELCAGSALVWRRVRRGDGTSMRVGIMAGSWTLPTARGRGLFTQMIAASKERCIERDAECLFAFVTHDNASRRRLEAAGSELVTSYYGKLVGAAETTRDVRVLSELENELFEAFLRTRQGKLGFQYASFEAWKGQYLERLYPVVCLEVAGVRVVAESRPDCILVLSVLSTDPSEVSATLAAVASWSGRDGRPLLCYSTLEGALPGDWHVIPGFITSLASQAGTPDLSEALVENGDRV